MNNTSPSSQSVTTTKYNPITFLSISLILGASVLIWLGLYSYNSYRESANQKEHSLQVEKLHGTVAYLDEVLNMSAQMAVSTGDLQWEKRFHQYRSLLNKAIKESVNFAIEKHSRDAVAEIDTVNSKLLEIENRIFNLVRQGRLDKAKQILHGEDYEKQKQIFNQGITHFVHSEYPYIRMENLRNTIIHLDEVLTMSARMAAATGDLKWKRRYFGKERLLDKAIKDAIKLAPESYS